MACNAKQSSCAKRSPQARRLANSGVPSGAKHYLLLKFLGWPKAGPKGGAEHKCFSDTFGKFRNIECSFRAKGLRLPKLFASSFILVKEFIGFIEYLANPDRVMEILKTENLKKYATFNNLIVFHGFVVFSLLILQIDENDDCSTRNLHFRQT